MHHYKKKKNKTKKTGEKPPLPLPLYINTAFDGELPCASFPAMGQSLGNPDSHSPLTYIK